MTDDDQAWVPRLLRDSGYRGRRLDSAWSEVLFVHADERWHGRGLDHQSALADALARMFPSAVARALFTARSDEATATTATTASTTSTTATAPPIASTPAASVEPEPAAPPAPEPEPRPEPPKILQRIVLPSYPANAVAEARDTLDEILKEIHETRPDFALMSPRLQKVHMLAWICRARGFDEQFTGEHRINALVRKIAHELTNVSKVMWPGSVQALQMSARPDCVVSELALKTIHIPRTWHEAGDLVQQHRDRSAHSESQLDDYGWADDPRRPPGGDPRSILREVVQLLEAIAGPVQEPPARHFPNPPEDMSPESLDAVVRAAQQLRAIRSHTLNPELWGAAMGRLRWLAGRIGDRAALLRRWIDPEFRPPVERPNTAANQEQKNAKRDALKSEVEALTTDTLAKWLVRAFEVFSTPEIAGMLDESLRTHAQSLDDEALHDADRRLRRRLRDLRAHLHGNRDAAPPEPSEPDDANKSEAQTTEPSEDADEVTDPLEAQVRSRVQGKSALFVSNRDDPDLKARLEDRLALSITWCDGNPRKVQAQCDSIARRSYDLVLIATGFQAHTIDGSLARAARAAEVPYVRVFKGRPLACVRALARTFGLDQT